jgi:hypothetical protein
VSICHDVSSFVMDIMVPDRAVEADETADEHLNDVRNLGHEPTQFTSLRPD